MPDFSIESGFDGPVVGVDEAGRGPWAGPVTIAAAWLDKNAVAGFLPGLDDSKKMTAASRVAFHGILTQLPHHHVVLSVPVEVIDRDGILKATLAGMARAAELLAMRLAEAGIGEAAQILIDGNQMPPLSRPAQTLVKGDSRSFSIAAASVIAKHERDQIMRGLACENPGYEWERNMGYGTAAHREALDHLGVTRHHRRSFAPIRRLLCNGGETPSRKG